MKIRRRRLRCLTVYHYTDAFLNITICDGMHSVQVATAWRIPESSNSGFIHWFTDGVHHRSDFSITNNFFAKRLKQSKAELIPPKLTLTHQSTTEKIGASIDHNANADQLQLHDDSTTFVCATAKMTATFSSEQGEKGSAENVARQLSPHLNDKSTGTQLAFINSPIKRWGDNYAPGIYHRKEGDTCLKMKRAKLFLSQKQTESS